MGQNMLSKEFVLAGKAVFTVSRLDTGARMTFRVTTSEFPEGSGKFYSNIFFMAGPDNERSYKFIGKVNQRSGQITETAKSKYKIADEDNKVWATAQWILNKIWKQEALNPRVELRHSGKCGRCGRTLTVPRSIDIGIGPECEQILGLAPAQQVISAQHALNFGYKSDISEAWAKVAQGIFAILRDPRASNNGAQMAMFR